jgi:elongator complex protein 3
MSTEASKTVQIEYRIVEAVILDETIRTKQDLQKVQNRILKEFGAPSAPPVFRLLETYLKNLQGKTPDSRIIKLFRKRAVRSLSGVSVISLLTKFWGCPGKCVYCPTFPDLPKSYVPSEPAVMRAELNAFDPARQVQNRLRSLESTGHAIAKCDVRIIG